MKTMYTSLIALAVLIISFIIIELIPVLQTSNELTGQTKDSLSSVRVHAALITIKSQTSVKASIAFNTAQLHIEKPADDHRYDNFQLYPIYATAAFLNYHLKLGPYVSLQEALNEHKLLISELGDGSDVNTLFAENLSRDTIIILGGEVVRGGKQDRMIARDFMLLPGRGKINISVFCVEHDRWLAEGERESFDTTVGIAPKSVRKASRESEAQIQVWEEVAELHQAYDVEEETQALAFALADEDMKDLVQPYLEELQHLQWPANVVGVVAVMENKIVGCDIFAQHSLFTRYYPNLLKSYCGNMHEAKYEPTMSFNNVQSFFKKTFMSDQSLDAIVSEGGTQLKNGRYRVHAAVY